MIVGGTPQQRGAVAAANNEVQCFGVHVTVHFITGHARACRVHIAMPTATAMRLCPQAIAPPVRIQHYADVSGEIRAILER